MPSHKVDRASVLGKAKRVLVKVGSSVLTTPQGTLDRGRVGALAGQVCVLLDQGRHVILVSSGAIAAGMGELGLPGRPTNMPDLQAAAAVGQGRLIQAYSEAFARHGRHVGQVLLSRDDMESRARFLNTRNTLRALAAMGCVPIINENDSVSIEEIRYGDNDFLAAHLATLIMADLVIMLSSVDGLYEPDAEGKPAVVPVVRSISKEVLSLDDGGTSAQGTGGMATKLRVAALLTRAGVPVVIANGRRQRVLPALLAGEPLGTLFLPAPRRMASRKRWIGFTARPKGRLVVDEGARKALVERGRSLLASGLKGVRGSFQKGDVVALAVGDDAPPFAQGLVQYSSDELLKIRGCHTREIAARLGYKDYDEVVHRDNLVILD